MEKLVCQQIYQSRYTLGEHGLSFYIQKLR